MRLPWRRWKKTPDSVMSVGAPTLVDDTPPYVDIWQELNDGCVVPFIGAGASIGNRAGGDPWDEGTDEFLPTASELARHLANRLRLNRTNEAPSDDLPSVADYYDSRVGEDVLVKTLNRIFGREYPMPRLHTVLARVDAPLLLVTTNYDDLIERALSAQGREYHLVIKRPVDAAEMVVWRPPRGTASLVHGNYLKLDPERETVVYKLHGSARREDAYDTTYMITEGHYLTFLEWLTETNVVPAVIGEALAKRHFLFLGYGLRDWNVRVILRQLHNRFGTSGNRPSWWIDPRASILARDFWSKRNVYLYRITIDDFLDELLNEESQG